MVCRICGQKSPQELYNAYMNDPSRSNSLSIFGRTLAEINKAIQFYDENKKSEREKLIEKAYKYTYPGAIIEVSNSNTAMMIQIIEKLVKELEK